MRTLLDFLSTHYHWFLLLLLEAVSIVIMFSYNSYQGAAWVTTTNSVAGMVYDMESRVQSFFALTKRNDDLSRRNIYLEQQVKNLCVELERTGMDSATLAAVKQPIPYKLIGAKVVQNSVSKLDNLMTIDKGEADGVRTDMGVISGKGVVGIVYMTGEHYSVVIPILSSRSNISCKIERRGYFGHLHWDGGASNVAYVDDIPRHARFKLYERIVTSGYSSVFPEGVAIGKILHVYNSQDGMAYRLQVQLYTDFANLRDVYVVDNTPMQEQLEVLRAARDTLYKYNK